jgi:hypothetical protein
VDFDYYMEETLHSKVLDPESFSPLTEGLCYGLSLGLKSCFMTFVFI